MYGITCDLKNVTSNAPSSVNSGSPLSVVLAGVDGTKVKESSTGSISSTNDYDLFIFAIGGVDAARVTIQTRYGGEMGIALGLAEILQWLEMY